MSQHWTRISPLAPTRPIEGKIGELVQGHLLHVRMGKGVATQHPAEVHIVGWMPAEVAAQASHE